MKTKSNLPSIEEIEHGLGNEGFATPQQHQTIRFTSQNTRQNTKHASYLWGVEGINIYFDFRILLLVFIIVGVYLRHLYCYFFNEITSNDVIKH